jgi:hypothetical protein
MLCFKFKGVRSKRHTISAPETRDFDTLRTLTASLIILLLPPSSWSFEPKFYDAGQDKKSLLEICALEKKADAMLTCDGMDNDSLNCIPKSLPLGYRNEHSLLKPRKDLMVVMLDKPLMMQGSEKLLKVVDRCMMLKEDLKYKRLVIMGAHSSGRFILYDSSEPSGKQLIRFDGFPPEREIRSHP